MRFRTHISNVQLLHSEWAIGAVVTSTPAVAGSSISQRIDLRLLGWMPSPPPSLPALSVLLSSPVLTPLRDSPLARRAGEALRHPPQPGQGAFHRPRKRGQGRGAGLVVSPARSCIGSSTTFESSDSGYSRQ